MVFSLTALLDELGMPQYHDNFIHNGFDSWDDVLDITEADMAAMTIKLGHRRRLQRRIEQERGTRILQLSDANEPNQQQSPTKKRRKYVKHPKPDTNAPKKPLSAYALFANDKRDEYKDLNWSFVDLAKEIGRQWQVLDEITRNKYHTRALQAKQRYQVADAIYSQTEECERYRRYLEEWKCRQSAKIQSQTQKRKADESSGRSKEPSTPSTIPSQAPSPQSENGNSSTATTTATSPVLSDPWSLNSWEPKLDGMSMANLDSTQAGFYGLPRFDSPYGVERSVQYTFLPPFTVDGIEPKLIQGDFRAAVSGSQFADGGGGPGG